MKNFFIQKDVVRFIVIGFIIFQFSCQDKFISSIVAERNLTQKEYGNYLYIIRKYMPPGEIRQEDNISKKINFFVYNYTRPDKDEKYSKTDLFLNRNMACAGRSYIFRVLLEYYKIQTRYMYLYNIPNQGNNTLVEVYYNDKWHLYDPAFGVFFTEDGKFNSEVLDMNQINCEYYKKDLSKYGFKAEKVNSSELDKYMKNNVETLYKNYIGHERDMDLKYFQIAENYVYHDTSFSNILCRALYTY